MLKVRDPMCATCIHCVALFARSCGVATGDGSAPGVAGERAYGLRDRAGVWLLDRLVKERGTVIAREPRLVLYSPAVSFSDCVGIAPDCVMIAVGL